MSKKSDSQANLASPQAKGQQGGQQKEDKPAPKKGGKQGMEDPKLSGKGKGPVKQEPPPPEKKKAPYELIQVDTNEFYQRYNKFLEEDKENKKKQAEYLKTYLENTGLKMAFRVIAAEAISKNMRPDEVLAYAAERLKELGKEIEKISINTATSNNPQVNQQKAGSTTTVPSNTTAKSTANSVNSLDSFNMSLEEIILILYGAISISQSASKMINNIFLILLGQLFWYVCITLGGILLFVSLILKFMFDIKLCPKSIASLNLLAHLSKQLFSAGFRVGVKRLDMHFLKQTSSI